MNVLQYESSLGGLGLTSVFHIMTTIHTAEKMGDFCLTQDENRLVIKCYSVSTCKQGAASALQRLQNLRSW